MHKDLKIFLTGLLTTVPISGGLYLLYKLIMLIGTYFDPGRASNIQFLSGLLALFLGVMATLFCVGLIMGLGSISLDATEAIRTNYANKKIKTNIIDKQKELHGSLSTVENIQEIKNENRYK